MIFTKEYKFMETSIFIPVVAYIFINLIAIIFGLNPQRGIHEFWGLFLVIVFFITVNLVKKKEIKFLVTLLIACSIVFALIGIYQYIKINKGFINVNSIRIRGNLGSIFDFAWFLMYMILLSISVFSLKMNNLYEKIFLVSAILIMSIALILTYTRGAWLGLISGVLVICFLKDKRIIIPVLLFISLSIYLSSSFKERAKKIQNFKSTSDYSRIEIWEKGIKIIKDNPLLGVGMENYELAADKKGKFEVHPHSHNNYIQQGVNAGILGLAAFLWIIYNLLNKGYGSIKNNLDDPYLKNINIGCFAGLISFLVSGIVDYSIKNDVSITLFWFLMGLLFIGQKHYLKE
ncbi:O-antigen ligase family protein [Candidatus Desantisbacteria bacterium]|nr:O-antigen ligase family protein [Candidatus Desantisbacteria bacterium]